MSTFRNHRQGGRWYRVTHACTRHEGHPIHECDGCQQATNDAIMAAGVEAVSQTTATFNLRLDDVICTYVDAAVNASVDDEAYQDAWAKLKLVREALRDENGS